MDIAELRKKARKLKETGESGALPLEEKRVEAKAEVPKKPKKTESAGVSFVGADKPLKEEPVVIVEENKPEEVFKGSGEGKDGMLEAITFNLGTEEYAIDIQKIKEVIKARQTTSVPRSSTTIVGIISLRGAVIPIVDLRSIMGLPVDGEKRRIIIVKDKDEFIGLLVDTVNQVVRVNNTTLEPPPQLSAIHAEFIKAIGRVNGKPFMLLEMDKVIEKV